MNMLIILQAEISHIHGRPNPRRSLRLSRRLRQLQVSHRRLRRYVPLHHHCLTSIFQLTTK